ncbi:MAG: aldo/keto reductase, partial [Bacillota bacterium]|nr:aldo/keto reductase [Bacillota bacterium]
MMKYRKMPRTELSLSEIGFGLSKLHLVTDSKEQTRILAKAVENGMNFFDFCGIELGVFRSFSDILRENRDKIFTQMHFGAVYKEETYGRSRNFDLVKSSFEKVLTAAGTDYTDFGMLHCVDEEVEFEEILNHGILDYVAELKKQGVVRYIGVSTHTPKMAQRLMKEGVIDMFMFSINPAFDYSIGEWAGGSYDERRDLYRDAEQKGYGITVMKTYAGGQLLRPETTPIGVTLTNYQCIRYALDCPGVVSCFPGISNMAELEHLFDYYKASNEETSYTILKDAAPTDAKGRCAYC